VTADAVAAELRAPRSLARTVSIAAYAVLGTTLVLTRSIGLGRSYWHDEIDTLVSFVRPGPSAILAGTYRPNDHELYNLAVWATASTFGESEYILRIWSAAPFVAAVLLVTAWLHVRAGVLTAITYLFLTTLSPLLLDLSRQGRGYGLAFLAMSAMLVAALEADRDGRTWLIAVFCLAGVAGTWVLPNFGLGFFATGAVLLTNRALRRRVAVGLAASALAVSAWYAPHLGDLAHTSQQRFGEPIPWFGLITSPVEQLLAPAMLWIEGPALTTDLSRLPLVAALTLVLIASPLLRMPRVASLLAAGFVFTFLVLWSTRTYLSARFVSYLLVPLFILAASGIAHLLEDPRSRPWLRASLAATMVALVVVSFAAAAKPVLRLPREAHRDAVEAIRARDPSLPVLAYTHHPSDLEFYLGRPLEKLSYAETSRRVCTARQPIAFVTQPFETTPVTLACAGRAGVEHVRLGQYGRGGHIDVWFVPPRP
jgi:hypothetical protein